jgi:predicted nucleic acid-binding protein
MIYCDTSVLVAAFAHEARTAATQQWLRGHERDLVISWWVETEFASAIAIKRRTGALDDAAADAVLAGWRNFAAGVAVESVERHHFEAVSAIILTPKTILRGGDALHLVIARNAGHDLATFDQQLVAACATHGVTVVLGP